MTLDVYADLFDDDLDDVADRLDAAMRADGGQDKHCCRLCHQPLKGVAAGTSENSPAAPLRHLAILG